MKRLIFTYSLILLSVYVKAQDSSTVFTYNNYIQQVMEHHPYAFQANLVAEMGKANTLQSRGAFDPRLFGNIDQKYFEDKQYYSHSYGGLKIPTWYGISFESGYSRNDGVYLNPEERLPDAGIWYAGLRLELGNGLIIDERRATLEKAKLQQVGAELQRVILLNELQRDASLAYWKWQESYEKVKLSELALQNAELRLNAVKQSALFGDRPYVDTVEAAMNVGNRKLTWISARKDFANAELKLEFYLWSNGFIPLELENTVPEPQSLRESDISLLDREAFIQQHPFLVLQTLSLAQQRVDLQLKREYLKPKLTLKYNMINEPIAGNPLAEYSPSNYTWGASFAYPLLLRQERGGLQLAKLKLNDQELKLKTTEANLSYTIGVVGNDFQFLQEQLQTSMELTELNETMYRAENSLFNLGESSLFMINTRENAWLKAKMEQIELHAKTRSAESELLFQLMLVKK